MSECLRCVEMQLSALYDKIKSGHYRTPDWQRGNIWPKKKKEEFEKTIHEKASNRRGHMPGAIVVYYLRNNKDCKYMYFNDGVQRGSTTTEIFEKIAKERSESTARDLFGKVTVSVQEYEYEDEVEAKVDYVRLNCGTGFTNYELSKPILCDLKDYLTWEKEVFKPINNTMMAASSRMGIKASKSRGKIHTHYRDDYALFLRFINGDKEATCYGSSRGVNISHLTNRKSRANVLESRLVASLQSLGMAEAKDMVEKFDKFIQTEVALYDAVWKEVLDANRSKWANLIETATPANFRWILCAAIYRKNNNIPRPIYRKFLVDFLTNTKGRSLVSGSSGSFAVSLSDMSRLGLIQEAIGSWLDQSVHSKKHRTRRNISQIKSGNVNGHDKSFAWNGEGPSKIQTAADNLSQGARDGLFAEK
jgi:hypothetical protein